MIHSQRTNGSNTDTTLALAVASNTVRKKLCEHMCIVFMRGQFATLYILATRHLQFISSGESCFATGQALFSWFSVFCQYSHTHHDQDRPHDHDSVLAYPDSLIRIHDMIVHTLANQITSSDNRVQIPVQVSKPQLQVDKSPRVIIPRPVAIRNEVIAVLSCAN